MIRWIRIPTLVLLISSIARAADPIVIAGNNHPEASRPDAGLLPDAGVANIQIFRACRNQRDAGDAGGWTYNHHVDMACWNKRLYVAWDSCEKDEDTWPSREVYSTSADGVHWTKPQELFPQGTSTALRMYFFLAANKRMLAIAGMRSSTGEISEQSKSGLIVREIHADHTLEPVYTLCAPASVHAKLPLFESSSDGDFVRACRDLLNNHNFLEQSDYGNLLAPADRMKWHDLANWPATEPSRAEFPRFGKAMAFFHRRDGALVALMKWGWVLISTDEGKTWSTPTRPGTLVTGMAKIWGQRTADNRYALFYNPDPIQRFPLICVTGDDGMTFSDMRTIHAELPPMRYPGKYKQPGPQYVRGISEWSSDHSFSDCQRATWIAYSMSKEDIWVSRVPAPAPDVSDCPWNTYSPAWAPAAVDGDTVTLEDRDPYDYARATRLFAPTHTIDLAMQVTGDAANKDKQPLVVELLMDHARPLCCYSDLPGEKTIALHLKSSDDGQNILVWTDDNKPSAVSVPQDAIFRAVSVRTGDRNKNPTPEHDHPEPVKRVRVTLTLDLRPLDRP